MSGSDAARTAFSFRYGSPGCTKQLLADQATINCCDKDGHTPLHYAAVEGDAEAPETGTRDVSFLVVVVE